MYWCSSVKHPAAEREPGTLAGVASALTTAVWWKKENLLCLGLLHWKLQDCKHCISLDREGNELDVLYVARDDKIILIFQ